MLAQEGVHAFQHPGHPESAMDEVAPIEVDGLLVHQQCRVSEHDRHDPEPLVAVIPPGLKVVVLEPLIYAGRGFS